MADGVRDLRRCKPIGLLSRSLQVDETLLLIRELTPSGWASTPAATMNGVAQLIPRFRNSYPLLRADRLALRSTIGKATTLAPDRALLDSVESPMSNDEAAHRASCRVADGSLQGQQ